MASYGGRYWFFIRLQQRQRNERCACKPSKWIRLIRPIQITKRTSIAVEMMFGLDVIADHAIDGIGRHSLYWFAVKGMSVAIVIVNHSLQSLRRGK